MNISKALAFILVLSMLVLSSAPSALGITINYESNGLSLSEGYNLDDSTLLQEKTSLGESALFQTSQLYGSGNNEVNQQVSGDGYIARNIFQARDSGHFMTGTSTSASALSGIKSLNLAGKGDVSASVFGAAGSTSTGQEATILGGDITTYQNVATSQCSSISEQNTRMKGDTGFIGTKSLSPKNSMAAVGEFSNSGDLNTELSSVAADRAAIYGTSSFLGQECLDNDVLQTLVSGDLGMETKGIFTNPKGDFGTYEITAVNIMETTKEISASQFEGWRWPDNSQIHILLSGPTGSPTTVAGPYFFSPSSPGPIVAPAEVLVAQEISKAANTWDLNTGQDLFRGLDNTNTPLPSNAVEISSYVPVFGSGSDGKNVYAWTYKLSKPIVAQTTTWYSDKSVKGSDGKSYNQAFESDCWLNSNYGWRIAAAENPYENSLFDVRTIATHELGHTLGLDDLYDSGNSGEIMYGYNNGAVKWFLGDGDKSGLWALYGQ
jgi:hypothetical protein